LAAERFRSLGDFYGRLAEQEPTEGENGAILRQDRADEEAGAGLRAGADDLVAWDTD